METPLVTQIYFPAPNGATAGRDAAAARELAAAVLQVVPCRALHGDGRHRGRPPPLRLLLPGRQNANVQPTPLSRQLLPPGGRYNSPGLGGYVVSSTGPIELGCV